MNHSDATTAKLVEIMRTRYAISKCCLNLMLLLLLMLLKSRFLPGKYTITCINLCWVVKLLIFFLGNCMAHSDRNESKKRIYSYIVWSLICGHILIELIECFLSFCSFFFFFFLSLHNKKVIHKYRTYLTYLNMWIGGRLCVYVCLCVHPC